MYHIKLTESQWHWLLLMTGYAMGAIANDRDASDTRKDLEEKFLDLLPIVANADEVPDDPEWDKG
jgi:hypothetical protein